MRGRLVPLLRVFDWYEPATIIPKLGDAATTPLRTIAHLLLVCYPLVGSMKSDSIPERIFLIWNAKKFIHEREFGRQQSEVLDVAHPGFRVRPRVIGDELQGKCVMIQALPALGQMQLLAARIAEEVNPGFVVETNRINNEGISVPFANRVAHPSGVQIRRVTSTVGINLTIGVFALKKL